MLKNLLCTVVSAGNVTSAGITGAVGGMAVAGAAKTTVGAAKMVSNAGGGITGATAAYAAGGMSGVDNIGTKVESSMGAGIKESVMKSYKGDNSNTE